MSTAGILNSLGASSGVASGNARTQQMAAEGSSAVQNFMTYMKETPAQQMESSWLAAHHLTLQQLNAMPPAQRLAIEKQMEQDIKNEITKKVQAASSGGAAGTTGAASAATAVMASDISAVS